MTALCGAVIALAGAAPAPSREIQFIVTADAHYGLSRTSFRGQENVDAHVVNAALVSSVNALPASRFPLDSGLDAGQRIGAVDFLVEAGDITNREEQTDTASIQPAAASWAQFVSDYVDGVRTIDHGGRRSQVFVTPGNHEASNAVGFYKTMAPATDRAPLVEIYNRMVAPPSPLTTATYDYQRDRVFFTRDIAGIHFVFVHIWPDSVMRARLDADLARVPPETPVIVFAHDQPDVEAKHFVNPNGQHDINATDQFENLLADVFKDGPTIDLPSLDEQAELEAFLARHPNVTAYFHGNSNWHQAYDWNGPGRSARLHTFRVDSPMKGAVSALDETRLSFAVVTLDTVLRTMTVRECLWNKDPSRVAWGDSATVTLEPRPSPRSGS